MQIVQALHVFCRQNLRPCEVTILKQRLCEPVHTPLLVRMFGPLDCIRSPECSLIQWNRVGQSAQHSVETGKVGKRLQIKGVFRAKHLLKEAV